MGRKGQCKQIQKSELKKFDKQELKTFFVLLVSVIYKQSSRVHYCNCVCHAFKRHITRHIVVPCEHCNAEGISLMSTKEHVLAEEALKREWKDKQRGRLDMVRTALNAGKLPKNS